MTRLGPFSVLSGPCCSPLSTDPKLPLMFTAFCSFVCLIIKICRWLLCCLVKVYVKFWRTGSCSWFEILGGFPSGTRRACKDSVSETSCVCHVMISKESNIICVTDLGSCCACTSYERTTVVQICCRSSFKKGFAPTRKRGCCAYDSVQLCKIP